MNSRTTFLMACATFGLAGVLLAGVEPTAVREELERIEDLRLLHRFAIQDLHDAKALAIYLEGWGGAKRGAEVETLFVEAENLYGTIRGVDYGATGMQAQMDVLGKDSPSSSQFDLLQRARGPVAQKVNEFWRRCRTLKDELTEQVTAAAKAKAQWELTDKPEPWSDPERDAGRQSGLRYGWNLGEQFFKFTEAEQDYLLGKGQKTIISFANVVWDPLSNWGDIEREPGKYDFTILDAAVGRVAKPGMKVALMLRSLTGTPPKRFIEKHGAECQFTTTVKDAKGERKVQSGINLFHAPTGEAFGKFLAAYMAHLKQKWPQAVEGVYAEGGQREIEAVPDESAAMDAYWKAWSKSATPWRTPEAILSEAQPDEAAVTKAEMCREAWLIEYLQRVIAGCKQGWAELPVLVPTMNDDFHRMFGNNVGLSRDAFAIAQLGSHPGSSTDSPASFTLLHSFAGGRWLWQDGIHSGCGTTPSAASVHPPFYDASRIIIGWPPASVRAYFPGNWFRYCDSQLGEAGIGSYYLAPRRAQEMWPLIGNTRLPSAQVAILWSQTSLRRDRPRELWRDVMAWGHLLKRTFFEFDYVTEDQLAANLKHYKVLILPNTQSMTADTCHTIREWVKAGGTLLGFGEPGLFDENGKRRDNLPLADVFGADVAKLRVPAPLEPDKLYTGHPQGSFIQPAPSPWQYATNLTAALKVNEAKPRAWFAGAERDVAIVEHTFGAGKSLLSGYPVGFLYWASAPYEFAYGLTQNRQLNYNHEQMFYEAWITRELEKIGVVRETIVASGVMLRAQMADDGDWFHVYRNTPTFQQYENESDRPVRTVYAITRKREGINNLYVALVHTEANYFWERGYFVSTLAGGQVTTSVALPQATTNAVVMDARLKVPVPLANRDGRFEFTTWLPAAQASAFAVAPDGKVRLFGPATLSGQSADDIEKRAINYQTPKPLAEVETLEPKKIAEFLEARRGKKVLVGIGNAQLKPAFDALAPWLKKVYQIEAEATMAGPRSSIRWAYMDGFGYNQYGDPPTRPDILIGNAQDNPLMWWFLRCANEDHWLPLEVNQDFPGVGHALVMLSLPITTKADGKPGGKPTDLQLILGASDPSGARQAVKALQRVRR